MTAGPVMTHRSAGAEMAERVAARLGAPGPRERPAPRGAGKAEHAETLSDMLFRRVDRAWSGPIPDEELERLAAEAAGVLGWDETRRERETRAFRDEWQRLYRPRRSSGRP
jgi:glycerol-3-phosphate dehydrogenase